MVVMGGWETFTRNGGSQEWGVWFYNGRLEIVKVFLHGWQRGANPLFYEDPLYCLFMLFQILSTPSPTSLSPPIPTSTVLSVVMFLYLNG